MNRRVAALLSLGLLAVGLVLVLVGLIRSFPTAVLFVATLLLAAVAGWQGLTRKIHQVCDGQGRPLVVLLGPSRGGDSPMFAPLLQQLRVARPRGGRPRTRPDAVIADKAYSSRGNRGLLRTRGITAVIAEPADQAANRRRRGSAGGRPPRSDADTYKRRNVVERWFNTLKQWRGLATRYDKRAAVYRGGIVLAAILTWLRTSGDTP